MKIYYAADHRGFRMAEELFIWLQQQNIQAIQISPAILTPGDDYVDYAKEVTKEIVQETEKGEDVRGVLICGSGVGMDITANRQKGIRSGLGISEEQVRASRADDNINILTIAADYIDIEIAKKMIHIFLSTPFKSDERYERRLEKIDK